MKSNIWYISKYANVSAYGANSRHASFCEEFAKAGHNVRLVTSNSSHLFDSLPNIKGCYFDHNNAGYQVTWVNTLKYTKATSLKRILSWIWFEFFVLMMAFSKRYEKPDIVIASSLSILSVISGCFYKKFYKAKFIFEVRDIWPQTLVDLKGLSSKHPLVWILGKVERLGYKYADKVIGTMPGLHKHVDAVVGLGHKVEFIPQGVDLSFYNNEQQDVDNNYIAKYLPQDKFLVTYAGTFSVAYALDYVINAARKLHESGNTNIHFVFLGNGLEKEHLEKASADLPNVVFAPRVAKNQVLSVLKRSDLLLHSFKMEKVFEFGISPNKFVDYMYAKKPIICMFSGYPSMLNEANCGEFIPSENSEKLIEAVLKYSSMNVNERDVLGQNAFEFLTTSRSYYQLSKKYLECINA